MAFTKNGKKGPGAGPSGGPKARSPKFQQAEGAKRTGKPAGAKRTGKPAGSKAEERKRAEAPKRGGKLAGAKAEDRKRTGKPAGSARPKAQRAEAGKRTGKPTGKFNKPEGAKRASKQAPKKAAPVEKPIPVPDSPCPVDHLCGGCKNIACPYSEQLLKKNVYMGKLLRQAGLLDKESMLRPILGMEDPFFYRNKVASPFARGPKNPKPSRQEAAKNKGKRARLDCQVLTGMYQEGTHKLVDTDGCLIENEQANEVIQSIKKLMVHFDIQPYDEDAGTGFLRHAIVRVGHESNEMLVTVVTNGREFPGSKRFCRDLIKKHPEITTIVQNVNTRQTNVILGKEEHVLYGPGFILDTLCGLSFRISSQSFYQVNATQTQVLYNAAINLAKLSGTETVIDAYCGTGTIGLAAAKHGAQRVIGVDSVASSISDARQNAQHNGIENARFVVGDAGLAMRAWAGSEIDGDTTRAAAEAIEDQPLDPANTVLMMDPPRAGSDETFLQAACLLGPARIVYISCNPETQVRDVQYLVKHGYALQTVQPVDMFPHTDHVESIALLTKE